MLVIISYRVWAIVKWLGKLHCGLVTLWVATVAIQGTGNNKTRLYYNSIPVQYGILLELYYLQEPYSKSYRGLP
ncbi:hypothetical protein F4803DRAFT_500389 [Xylaria telfairii]|nr:hypothetical protein F4803DRAFT_500389 [Xylaria telfairii]